MISKTFAVSLLLRKDKTLKGTVSIPIYLRVTINGQITIFSTKKNVQEKYWDKSTSRVYPVTKELKELNNHLDMLVSQINQAYTQLVRDGKAITVNTLKKVIYGENDGKTVLQVTAEHNIEFEALVGKKYSYGSYKNYKTTYLYLQEYINKVFNRNDLQLAEVDYKFGNDYYQYLMSSKPCNHNGAVKHIQRLKKIFNYAVMLGYIDKSPFQRMQLSIKPFHRNYLSMENLKTLGSVKLPTEALRRVRDIFLFQCYTGLAYSDVKNLTVSNVVDGEKGERWLIVYRQKTNTRSPIPLLPKASMLLAKYIEVMVTAPGSTIFPVITNQKMNKYLKEIIKFTDINIQLTTHVGRHTFATTVTLANGVPIETVSKMLGHSNLRTTQIYAKVVDTKIGNDMRKLNAKLKKSKS